MYLLGLGMVLLGLKLLGLGPVAAWDWWVVLMPLALAAIWWPRPPWWGARMT